MSTWLLVIVLYTGEMSEIEYETKALCEAAWYNITDHGEYTHVSIADCVEHLTKPIKKQD